MNFARLGLVSILCLAFLGGCENGPAQSRQYASTLPAAGLTRISLSGSNGDIHLIAASVDRISMQARLKTHALQGLNGDTVAMARHGSEADIVSQCGEQSVLFFSAQNCDVDFWITYPRALQASISLTNGDITIRGSAASVDARTTNGDLTIDGTVGTVSARTTNGDVDVDDASGDIAALSSEGNVSASLTSKWAGHSIALKTHFGDVSLQVPQNFRATLHVGTLAGDVRGSQQIPAGDAIVDVSTVFGDVTLSRNE